MDPKPSRSPWYVMERDQGVVYALCLLLAVSLAARGTVARLAGRRDARKTAASRRIDYRIDINGLEEQFVVKELELPPKGQREPQIPLPAVEPKPKPAPSPVPAPIPAPSDKPTITEDPNGKWFGTAIIAGSIIVIGATVYLVIRRRQRASGTD